MKVVRISDAYPLDKTRRRRYNILYFRGAAAEGEWHMERITDYFGCMVFDDRVTAFAPQTPQTIPGDKPFTSVTLDTGAKVQPNGDVHFGFYAPKAGSVEVVFNLPGAKKPLPLTKGEDGVWRGVLPYDPLFCGPKAFTFQVDGADVVSPFCPEFFIYNRTTNYVEIPDPNAPYVLMRDVPHGTVAEEFYWSDAFKAEQRCLIYLPPEYYKGGEFPVLFLQHGNSENETSWIFNGKINHIMDNLIADGKAVPFIVVMNDGMQRAEYEGEMDSGRGLAHSLIENCIPMLEKKYRVRKDKWGRAIAGFSMGSCQSSIIGLEFITAPLGQQLAVVIDAAHLHSQQLQQPYQFVHIPDIGNIVNHHFIAGQQNGANHLQGLILGTLRIDYSM